MPPLLACDLPVLAWPAMPDSHAGPGCCFFPTALGECGIAWAPDGLILAVQLPESSRNSALARLRRRLPEVQCREPQQAEVVSAIARIQAALQGERDDLCSIALDMAGVQPFQQRVYEVARAIPPGRTLTYGEVAALIGEPGASRAVGRALGDNPFAPVVPCHRVLAAGSRSGGFSAHGGVDTKLRMLQIERARFGAEAGLFDDLPLDAAGD